MTVRSKEGKHRIRWTGKKWVDGCGHTWEQSRTVGVDFTSTVHGEGKVTEPEYGDKNLSRIWTVEFRSSEGYKLFRDGK